jgi:hypothetical protein
MLVLLHKSLLVLIIESKEFFLVVVVHLFNINWRSEPCSSGLYNQNRLFSLWRRGSSFFVFGSMKHLTYVASRIQIPVKLVVIVLLAFFVVVNLKKLPLLVVLRGLNGLG